MNQEHPHARTMIEYGKDLLKDKNAHAKWQCRYKDSSDPWINCTHQLKFEDGVEYRRELITINGRSIPSPEVYHPMYNEVYYVVDIACGEDEPVTMNTWSGEDYDLIMLRNGLVHLNRDHAISHAEALISITKRKLQ